MGKRLRGAKLWKVLIMRWVWKLKIKNYYFEEDKEMLSGVFYMLYLWINLW